MRRRLFNFLSVVSLLLCLATAMLWVRTWPVLAPVNPDPANSDGVQRVLAKELQWLRFDGIALDDVLHFMRDVSGAKIHVDWWALKKAGVERETPVTCRLRDVSFGHALADIISVAPGLEYVTEGDGHLRFHQGRLGERPSAWLFGQSQNLQGARTIPYRESRA
ncbi:MAG: hypothetical protein ACHRHE_17890 [Tepidisphaerales bacterium]